MRTSVRATSPLSRTNWYASNPRPPHHQTFQSSVTPHRIRLRRGLSVGALQRQRCAAEADAPPILPPAFAPPPQEPFLGPPVEEVTQVGSAREVRQEFRNSSAAPKGVPHRGNRRGGAKSGGATTPLWD